LPGIAAELQREIISLFTTAQPPAESSATPAQRIGWAILILLTLYICYFSHLGVIGFVGPDEPRYAWIARDMAESGDWVTPRLYGKPWFEKPPLLYWGGAVFFKLFGDRAPETAARLPSAISALLATLALAWLAWRTYGEECARWLLLLLPTSVGMIGFSHAAATDMPFAGMLTIAMVCAAVVLGLVQNENTPILPHTPWLALLLFGFFLGLAVLAKGPAGIILTGGAVFFWAIFTKRWRDVFRLLHPAAIAAFCVTALPWYILCARRNPDFFRIFIIEHNFKRYLTPEFQHIQPFWFYIPILFLGFIPWAIFILPAAKSIFRIIEQSASRRAFLILLISWVLFPLLFFSSSHSKLPGYILPVFPPFALLVATSIRPAALSKKIQWAALAIGSTLIACGALISPAVRWLDVGRTYNFPPSAMAGTCIALLAGLCTTILGFRRRFEASLLVAQLAVVAITFVVPVGTLATILDAKYSTRTAVTNYRYDPLFEGTVWQRSAQEPFTYSIPRSYQYSLNFYFHRELHAWPELSTQEAIVFVALPSAKINYLSGLKCARWNSVFTIVPCRTHSLFELLPRDSGGRQPQQKE